jgi:hypothetical protein
MSTVTNQRLSLESLNSHLGAQPVELLDTNSIIEFNNHDDFSFEKVLKTLNRNSEYEHFINEAKRVTKGYKSLYIPYFMTFKSKPVPGTSFLPLASLKLVLKNTFRELDALYFQNQEKKGLSFVKFTFPGYGSDGKFLPHFHSLIYLPRNRNLILALEAIYNWKLNNHVTANGYNADADIWSRYYTSDIKDFFDYAGRGEGESEEGFQKLDIDLSNLHGYRQLPNGQSIFSSTEAIDSSILLAHHREAYNTFADRLRRVGLSERIGLDVEQLLLPPDISSKIKRVDNYDYPRASLEIVRKNLEQLLPQVYLSDDKLVHLIDAKVGVGKTTILKKLPELQRQKMENILLVSLRHDAKDSITIGHPFPQKPELLKAEDDFIRANGLSSSRYFAELKARNPFDPRVIEHERYGKDVVDALTKHTILKITHKRFFSHFSREDMNKFGLIIFDECLLKERFNPQSIGIRDLQLLVARISNSEIGRTKIKLMQSLFARVLKTKEGHLKKMPKISNEFMGEIETLIDTSQEMKVNQILDNEPSSYEHLSENLLYFLKSKYFVRVGHSIKFVKPFEFPDKKIIILSGTASKTTYTQLFGDRFVHHELPSPHKLAKIRQFSDYSFSKTSLALNDTHYMRVISAYKLRGYAVITYKKYKLIVDLNLGATESSNSLKGRNILIPGTMNPPVYYIRLLAAELELPYKTIKDYKACKTETHTYNGMTFPYIALSENISIRNLQFDFTSCILEQAVGRGRWSEEEVDIVVYSNFPCSEAEYYVDDEVLESD